MTCFNPKYGKFSYGRTKKGNFGKIVKLITKKDYDIQNELISLTDEYNQKLMGTMIIPCGKCLGCKLDYSKMWGLRGLIESKVWKKNCFVTLTYNNEHLPKDKNLHKEDIQDFLKRLRKHYTGYQSRIWYNKRKAEEIIEYPIRVFYSGEYGDLRYRSHFHVGIFNWCPDDLKFLKYNKYGDPMYTSKTIEKLWSINGKQIGFVTVEDMNYNTAQYIARYTVKKCFNDHDETIKLKGLKPEFIETSRKGGLGYQLYENKEEWEKLKRNYGIFIKNKKRLKLMGIPQYYKNKWKKENLLEYFTSADQNKREKDENIKKLLAQTDYTLEEYMKIQKRKIIEKLKKKQSLKRNRIEEENDNDSN